MPVKTYAAPSGTFNHFGQIRLGMEDRLSKVVRAAGFNINERIQRNFRGPKSGRWYGGHRASAPGEAPAIDTGAYASSIRVEALDPFHAIVATNSEQGPYLEFGTRRMEPRPHFSPAAREERPEFEKAVASAMRPR